MTVLVWLTLAAGADTPDPLPVETLDPLPVLVPYQPPAVFAGCGPNGCPAPAAAPFNLYAQPTGRIGLFGRTR